jgi:hypothetical protein
MLSMSTFNLDAKTQFCRWQSHDHLLPLVDPTGLLFLFMYYLELSQIPCHQSEKRITTLRPTGNFQFPFGILTIHTDQKNKSATQTIQGDSKNRTIHRQHCLRCALAIPEVKLCKQRSEWIQKTDTMRQEDRCSRRKAMFTTVR